MIARAGTLAVVMLAGGCDQLFNIDSFQHIDAHQRASGEGSGDIDDGSAAVDAAPYCAGAFVDDTFTMTKPCSDWGMPFTSGPNASVMQGNGMLVVDVGDVLQGNQGESTYLAIYESSEGPSIGVRDGMLRFGPVNGLQP